MIYLQQRLVPPFRADIAARFPMSERLATATAYFNDGKIDDASLTMIEDEEIGAFVRELRYMGVDVACDGGWRHDMSAERFVDALCGDVSAHPALRHFNYLLSVTPMGMTARQMVVAPAVVERMARDGGIDCGMMLEAWGRLMSALYDLGCRNVMLEGYAGECLGVLPDGLNVTVSADAPVRLGDDRINGLYLAADVAVGSVGDCGDATVVALGVRPGEATCDVIERIEKASDVIPMERLCLYAQPGLACAESLQNIRSVIDISGRIW